MQKPNETNEINVYGVFDGQNMVGEDHKIYRVPENYASKSKLSEGDQLRCFLTVENRLIFKQIERVDTTIIRAKVLWEMSSCYALANNKKYQILRATAVFFRLEDGDEVLILLPKDREVSWVAVENVIKFLKDPDRELELVE